MKLQTPIIAALTLTLVAWAGAVDAAKIYKWVDENGNVQYTTTPPPESAKKDREVLNEQGQTVDKKARELTEKELEAKREFEAEAAELRRLDEERKAHDRLLLSTYTSVADMETQRDSVVSTIDSQIRVTGEAISRLEQTLLDLMQRRKSLVDSGQTVPEALDKDIANTTQDLRDNQRYLLERQDEKKTVRADFARDIERFKELRGRRSDSDDG